MDRSLEPRKALVWAIALTTTAGACASTGTSPRPFPMPGPRNPEAVDSRPDVHSAEEGRAEVVRTALDLRGVPYKNGGQTPDGFDCSGFTQYVFAVHGMALPRGVVEQFSFGKSVPPIDVVPGDLIFFATAGEGPTHVAIAIGGDAFVHAPSSKGVVRIERLSLRYWAQRLIGVRRMTEN